MSDFDLRLASPPGRYLQRVIEFVAKTLDWKDKHDAHDHSDPEVKRLCLREWSYIEHEGKILDEIGRQLEVAP